MIARLLANVREGRMQKLLSALPKLHELAGAFPDDRLAGELRGS